MHLKCRAVRVVAVIALGTVTCGAQKQSFYTAPQETTSTESSTTSSTPTSTAPVAIDVPTTPAIGRWVVATANLAGLPSECGNMSLLSARPGQDMVIAGVARQGLWVSENGSNTWMRLGQGPGSAVITNRSTSILYDPNHPNTFWESGVYNGGGLYQTVDNGTTFRQVGDLTHTDFVSVDFTDPTRSTLLSGRHEHSNLYRSADGGATWVDLSSTLPAGVGFTTAPFVVNAQLHLLGTKGMPGSGVFRTTDGGATWSLVFRGGVSGPALAAKSDGAIYWLLENGNGLIKSTDQGRTWQKVLGSGRISPNFGSLLELPDGRLATVGLYVIVRPDGGVGTFGVGVIVSADHGVTWRAIGPPLPYTPTGITYAPSRKAFYAWRFDCTFTGNTSVKANAIVRLDYNYKTQ